MQSSSRIAFITGWLAALVLAALPAALRMLHMAENDYAFVRADRWGFIGDAATGLGVLALLSVVGSWSRIGAAAIGVLWAALCFGWYEFLREFGSHYFLVHALYVADPTFLKGSAAGIAHPLLAVLVLACAVVFAWRAAPLSNRTKANLVAAGLMLVVVPGSMPLEYNQPLWRLQSFLLPNLADVGGRVLQRSGSIAAAAADPEVDSVFEADFAGDPRLALPGKPRNVLLVMIEGASGGSIPYLAAHHGVTSKVAFTGLDKLARENLAFSTFVTHQRQTNRGEYAALCGDFPKLGTEIPKMTEIANGQPKRCLPQVLREHGYATLYIQSAYLPFMFKDKFMPKVGFDAAHGEDWFDPKHPLGGWGVDDRALYESALPEIETLDRAGKPWFVTLLTSGTHHPFHFPADYAGYPEAEREFRAMQFADEAVSAFVEQLRQKGLLDDTLVLITSDEASFVHETGMPKAEALAAFTANWGFMVAVTPEGASGRVDEPFQQADITVSILDYLGLRDETDAFLGRSFFRAYNAPRSIYFANLYTKLMGSYRPGAGLDLCDEALTSCTLYDVPNGRLFSADVTLERVEKPSPHLRAVQARSLLPALPQPAGAFTN